LTVSYDNCRSSDPRRKLTRHQNRAFAADVNVNKTKSETMADEDITLNEDQLLESLEETNGEQETEITTENEVS